MPISKTGPTTTPAQAAAVPAENEGASKAEAEAVPAGAETAPKIAAEVAPQPQPEIIPEDTEAAPEPVAGTKYDFDSDSQGSHVPWEVWIWVFGHPAGELSRTVWI